MQIPFNIGSTFHSFAFRALSLKRVSPSCTTVATCFPSLENIYPKFNPLDDPAHGETDSYNNQSPTLTSYVIRITLKD